MNVRISLVRLILTVTVLLYSLTSVAQEETGEAQGECPEGCKPENTDGNPAPPFPTELNDFTLGSRVVTGAALVVQTHIDDAGDDVDVGLYGGEPTVAFMPYVAVRFGPLNATETRLFCAVKDKQDVDAARRRTEKYARASAAHDLDSDGAKGLAPKHLSADQVYRSTGWDITSDARCSFAGLSAYFGGVVPYTANITDRGNTGALSRSVKLGVSSGILYEVYQGLSLTAGWSLMFAEFKRSSGTRMRAVSGFTGGIGYTIDVVKLVAGKL